MKVNVFLWLLFLLITSRTILLVAMRTVNKNQSCPISFLPFKILEPCRITNLFGFCCKGGSLTWLQQSLRVTSCIIETFNLDNFFDLYFLCIVYLCNFIVNDEIFL